MLSPGDAIAISNGTVEVNGSPLAEPYLGEQGCTYTATGRPYFESALAPDQYFVLGDNRRNSIDARIYGPVARHRILGVIRSP